MKNSIFTIAFLLATGIAFAQETPTADMGKTKTKSNNTNERVSTTINSETPTADVVKNRTKSNNTNERVSTTTDSTSVDGSKKEYVGHVTLNRRDVKPNSSDTNSDVTIVEGIVSEKKHTKTGHVTLLK